MTKVEQHNQKIHRNVQHWEKKPILRKIYKEFHKLIAVNLTNHPKGSIVELGSGMGNIKEVIPRCIRTDLFQNPWIDRVENAYSLSFADGSVSDLILFDIFHHLRYPGSALKEFLRVLMPEGRVIIFEPYISILGFIVFGLFHDEPMGYKETIQWFSPSHWSGDNVDYYAAQANATRVFFRGKFENVLADWKYVKIKRLSAISYVASGGYSKPQLYPNSLFPMMRFFDKICDFFPFLFATRVLIVIEKSDLSNTTSHQEKKSGHSAQENE